MKNELVLCNTIETCTDKRLCYGGRDGISGQTLLAYSRIFGRKELAESHIEIKRRFCKHDSNFMNSGVNSLTKIGEAILINIQNVCFPQG